MNIENFKDIVREIIREELQSTLSEEEYDQARDAWLDDNPGSSWSEFRRRGGDLSPWYPKTSTGDDWGTRRRGRRMSSTDWNQILGKTTYQAQQQAAAQAAAAPADKQALLAQKVKYKDEKGQEHEATVKSLLGYAKDHPGRKIAARMYAQFMAKTGQQRKEEIGEAGRRRSTLPVRAKRSQFRADPYPETPAPRAPKSPPREIPPLNPPRPVQHIDTDKYRIQYNDPYSDDPHGYTLVPWQPGERERHRERERETAARVVANLENPYGEDFGEWPIPDYTPIEYVDANGKKRKAMVRTLIKYPPEHPGRKAADAALDKARAAKKQSTAEQKVCEGDGCLDEKSVPQPYDRKKARKMSKSQVDNRKRIGRNMLSNEKTVSKFRKKFGDDWKDHLWAAASSAAFRSSGSNKGDDKKK